MQISQTIHSLSDVTRKWREQGLVVGFVPTMGNLHAGHISLVEQAKSRCDRVVVSIFVNPLQFNEASDFNAYPKTLEADQQKLIGAEVDLLFLPDTDLIYPQGQAGLTKVVVPEITEELEGAHRPGHFVGVSTVVNKLFNLVQPQQAFFGEKDFQQLLLVQKMVQDLNMAVEIIAVPTRRETDGLAMSSRNARLSEEQRMIAPKLHQVLLQAKQQVLDRSASIEEIELRAMHELENAGFAPEYVSVRSTENLQPVAQDVVSRIILAAARLGDVRLIDNLFID